MKDREQQAHDALMGFCDDLLRGHEEFMRRNYPTVYRLSRTRRCPACEGACKLVTITPEGLREDACGTQDGGEPGGGRGGDGIHNGTG